MRIGLDFDNTIVCYDEAFHTLALEHKAIPADLPRKKEDVKAYLQAQGRNDFWTELQGFAYGPRMETATVFPGFEQFLSEAKSKNLEIFIVSHRSPRPYSGLDCDLHVAARTWLQNRAWYQNGQIKPAQIFFEATKTGKIDKIKSLNLDVFVDDLPEILAHEDFPERTRKILFCPSGVVEKWTGSLVRSWSEISPILKLT